MAKRSRKSSTQIIPLSAETKATLAEMTRRAKIDLPPGLAEAFRGMANFQLPPFAAALDAALAAASRIMEHVERPSEYWALESARQVQKAIDAANKPPRRRKGKGGLEPAGAGKGKDYQAERVDRALDAMVTGGLKLSNHTLKELCVLASKRIPKIVGLVDPSPKTVRRTVRKRLKK